MLQQIVSSVSIVFPSVKHFQLRNWYWIYVIQSSHPQSHISKEITLHNPAASDPCLNPHGSTPTIDSRFWHGRRVWAVCIPLRAVNSSTVSLKACTEPLSSTEPQEQLAPRAGQEYSPRRSVWEECVFSEGDVPLISPLLPRAPCWVCGSLDKLSLI